MRLLTAISIASLIVSIAAVVFVLGLYAELDKSEPETPVVEKEHTQELSEDMVGNLMYSHIANQTFRLDASDDEAFKQIPGYRCIWARLSYDGAETTTPYLYLERGMEFEKLATTLHYSQHKDVWLYTSSDIPHHGDWCNGVTTWTIDDNTGKITYGHPDEK